jgi:flagellar hook-basal body complex protein FliE
MSIPAMGGITPVTFPSIESLSATSGVAGAAATGAPSTSGVDFANAIDSLQGMQANSDSLAMKAVTGDLDDVHDYTLASARAGVAFDLTAAVRNKAVEAFTEIMRMQA